MTVADQASGPTTLVTLWAARRLANDTSVRSARGRRAVDEGAAVNRTHGDSLMTLQQRRFGITLRRICQGLANALR